MYTFDIDKISELICLYAHLPQSQSQRAAALAENAASFLDSILLRAPESAEEITRCEHAAACTALCDLAKINAAAFEPVLTENGNAGRDGKSAVTLDAAEKLRSEALGRISGMINTADFLFEGVEG